MFLLLHLLSQLSPAIDISAEHFALRFKWAIKADDLASYKAWQTLSAVTDPRQCITRAKRTLLKLATHTRGDYKVGIREA